MPPLNSPEAYLAREWLRVRRMLHLATLATAARLNAPCWSVADQVRDMIALADHAAPHAVY